MTEDALLEAALVWDYIPLSRSEDAGAHAFASVMALNPLPHLPEDDSSLSVAARGLSAELNGDGDIALECYDKLVEEREGLAQLLGLLLRLWSAHERSSDIDAARAAIAGIAKQDLRASLRCKLLTIRWAGGRFSELNTLWQDAREDCRHLPELMAHLALFGFNELQVRVGLPIVRDAIDTPLIDQPWLEEEETALFRTAIHGLFENSIAPAGTKRFTFGGPDLFARSVALDNQTIWAGQFWALKRRRFQNAQAIAIEPSPSDGALLYALACHVFARATNLREFFAKIEPGLRLVPIDYLGLVNSNIPEWFAGPRNRALTAFIDFFTDEQAKLLIGQTEINPQSKSWENLPELLRAIGWRFPKVYVDRLCGLPMETANRVFLQAPPGFVSRLSPHDRRRLAAIVEQVVIDSGKVPPPYYGAFRAEVAEGRDDPAQRADWLTVSLADAHPHWVTPGQLEDARISVQARAEGIVEASQSGSFGLETVDSFETLGILSSVSPKSTAHTIAAFLVRTAAQPGLIRDVKFSALRGLRQMAARGKLNSASFAVLRAARETGEDHQFIFQTSADSYNALLDALLFRIRPRDKSSLARILGHSRSDDAEARFYAVEAIVGVLLEGSGDTTLAFAAVSALFDRSPAVQRAALVGSGVVWTVAPDLRVALANRVLELLIEGERDVRLAALVGAKSITRSSLRSQARNLATGDPAWSIRSAARS